MKEVKNIIVPCWVYENDQGIPDDVCDYFVNKYQNAKTTSGKTDGKNKELIDKKVRDVKKIDLPRKVKVVFLQHGLFSDATMFFVHK